MAPEERKDLIRRALDELWNKGRLEVIDELTGDDVVAWGQAGHGEALKGSAAFRGYAENLHKSYTARKSVDQRPPLVGVQSGATAVFRNHVGLEPRERGSGRRRSRAALA